VGKPDVEKVMKSFIDTVQQSVKKGEKVSLPGFGGWSQTQRKARTARNPRTGAAVKVPAGKGVKFTVGATFKDIVAAKRGTAAAKTAKAPAKKAAPARAAKAPARARPAAAPASAPRSRMRVSKASSSASGSAAMPIVDSHWLRWASRAVTLAARKASMSSRWSTWSASHSRRDDGRCGARPWSG